MLVSRNRLDYGPIRGINGEPRSSLFSPSETQNYEGTTPCYRLPGLTNENPLTKTILAYAVTVKTNLADYQGWSVVCKKITNEGEIVGPIINVYSDAALSNFVTGPSMVCDRDGRFHCMYTQGTSNGADDPHRFFYTYSDSDGSSWSSPTEITSNIAPVSTLYPFVTFSSATDLGGGQVQLNTATNNYVANLKIKIPTGAYAGTYTIVSATSSTVVINATYSAASGSISVIPAWMLIANGNKGIVLDSGRIVIPYYYRYFADGSGDGYANIIYSDNGGASWASGTPIDETITNNKGTLEPCVVETNTPNQIYMMGRHKTAGYRWHTVSNDGGVTWSNVTLDNGSGGTTNLAEANGTGGCQGAIARYDKNNYIMSHVADTVNRSGIALRISSDLDSKLAASSSPTWSNRKQITWTCAAYSAVTVTSKGTIICIYEGSPTLSGSGVGGKILMSRLNLQSFNNTINKPTEFKWCCNEWSNGSKFAFLPLGGLSSLIRDFGGYGQHGLLSGVSTTVLPTYVTDPSTTSTWLKLASGQTMLLTQPNTFALDFDSYVTDSGECTIQMDMQTSGTGVLIGSNSTGAGWDLVVNTGGKPVFTFRDGTHTAAVTGNSVVNDANPHRLTAIRNKTNSILSISIDNGVVVSGADNTTSTSNGAPKCVGQYYGGINHITQDLSFRIPSIARQALSGNQLAPYPFIPPVNPSSIILAKSPADIAGLKMWLCSKDPYSYRCGTRDQGANKVLSDSLLCNPPTNGMAVDSMYDKVNNYLLNKIGWSNIHTTGPIKPHVWMTSPGSAGLQFEPNAIGALDFVQTGMVFTIAGWVKPSSVSSQCIFDTRSSGASNTDGFTLYTYPGGRPQIDMVSHGSNTSLVTSAGATVSSGNWVHFAFVSSGTGTPCRIYATPYSGSGTLVQYANSTSNTPTTGSPATAAIYFGDRAGGARSYWGAVSDLVFYNTALTSGDVQYLYDIGSFDPSRGY